MSCCRATLQTLEPPFSFPESATVSAVLQLIQWRILFNRYSLPLQLCKASHLDHAACDMMEEALHVDTDSFFLPFFTLAWCTFRLDGRGPPLMCDKGWLGKDRKTRTGNMHSILIFTNISLQFSTHNQKS